MALLATCHQTLLRIISNISSKNGGLYTAPPIPAGIQWNPGIPAESGGIKIWQRALPILPFQWVLHSSGMGGGMVIPVEHVPEWHRTGMQLESSGIFHRNDNELNQ